MRRRCSFYRSKPKTVPARCRTMVLGHSFVARLGTYINRKVHDKIDTNLGFDDTNLDVHLYGVGGRMVTKIRELDMGHVESFQPHTVHLEIGTNELSSDNANPTSVAEQVCSLVHLFTNFESWRSREHISIEYDGCVHYNSKLAICS